MPSAVPSPLIAPQPSAARARAVAVRLQERDRDREQCDRLDPAGDGRGCQPATGEAGGEVRGAKPAGGEHAEQYGEHDGLADFGGVRSSLGPQHGVDVHRDGRARHPERTPGDAELPLVDRRAELDQQLVAGTHDGRLEFERDVAGATVSTPRTFKQPSPAGRIAVERKQISG